MSVSKYLTLCVLPTQNLNPNIIPKPKQKRITKYTFEIFLERATNIHGNNFDYSEIQPSDIKGRDSKVPVKCNTCGHKWRPSIHDHITHKSKCPKCSGNAPWNLEKLLLEAIRVHGDQYDYSAVTKDHIKNNQSHISVKCNICEHKWNPNIHSHINHGTRCPGCAKRIPWTLERFLTRVIPIHGDHYDYTNITEEDIQNCNSYVTLICKICRHQWETTVDSHVKGHGCRRCNTSKGEKVCMIVLDNMNIDFDIQFKINALPRRPFDFSFEHLNHRWLLEFDGTQHFHINDFFHDDEEEFHNNQVADVMKTRVAVDSGYKVIHIDYTQIDYIAQHLVMAFELRNPIYFSTPNLYKHHAQ